MPTRLSGRAFRRNKSDGAPGALAVASISPIAGRNAMASGGLFPLNAWYPAGWGHEIQRELTARTICGKDVVLYRRSDGVPVALEDACWHRLLPLSLVRLVGDQLMCGYHGLVFNSA